MAVIHRALFTWFLVLLFLIFVALRVDAKTQWNWFVLFIPIWIYDCILLLYILYQIAQHLKGGRVLNTIPIQRKLWYLLAWALKVSFQVLLCIRQNYSPSSERGSLFIVLGPLIALLSLSSLDVLYVLVRGRIRYHDASDM
ncbi:transmembrane protein 60 [Neocloeon triangulifer]|uniref:transmembrane protein 60 n=1 Tax=Neocloeon triangulifer TaxID=2078957 RepID=UPI00286F001D|nr:transmembrane protein 60 [Neocloeon triangulifer]